MTFSDNTFDFFFFLAPDKKQYVYVAIGDIILSGRDE